MHNANNFEILDNFKIKKLSTMKKIFAILAITCMGQLTFAQEKTSSSTEMNKPGTENKGFHKKGKHHKAEMMKQLNLNDEQKAKLKEMKSAEQGKKDAIKNDSKLTEEQKKEQMKALKDERRKNMQSVLTDEQKQKVKEMKSKMKDEKHNRKKMKDGKGEEAVKEDTKTPS